MKYFKNVELASLYHVSEKSVRNWIAAAEAGKLDLDLYTENGKHAIANTVKNTNAIEKIVEKNKKFRNKRGYKVVQPSEKFYRLFNKQDIADIISNIDIHREIPHLYSYFDGGAEHWDTYMHKLLDDPTPNTLTKTIELLTLNTDYLDNLIKGNKVNVIDLGVGNSLPVKSLLQHLVDNSALNRYIAIDTSKDMLDVSERNIKKWFGNSIRFEKHKLNIAYDRFDNLLINDSFETDKTVNLVLFLGATILNLREPEHAIQTINNSMGKDDLLLLSLKLDTENARRYFDFAANKGASTLDLKERAILDLMNIDPSYYEVEQFFDEAKMARQIQVRLKVALSIEFRVGDGKRIVDLNKDDSILLWRAKHQTAIDTINQFDRNGFDLVQATRSKDQEFLLLIAKIKTDATNL